MCPVGDAAHTPAWEVQLTQPCKGFLKQKGTAAVVTVAAEPVFQFADVTAHLF